MSLSHQAVIELPHLGSTKASFVVGLILGGHHHTGPAGTHKSFLSVIVAQHFHTLSKSLTGLHLYLTGSHQSISAIHISDMGV